MMRTLQDKIHERALKMLFEFRNTTTNGINMPIGSYVRCVKPANTKSSRVQWAESMDLYHNTIGLVVGVDKSHQDAILVVVCKTAGGHPADFVYDSKWLTPVSRDQVAEQVVRQLAVTDRMVLRRLVKELFKDTCMAADMPEWRTGTLVKRANTARAPIAIVLAANAADEIVYAVSVVPTGRVEKIELDKIVEPSDADLAALSMDERRELCAMHAFVAHKYTLMYQRRTKMIATSVMPLPMARLFAPPPQMVIPLPDASSI